MKMLRRGMYPIGIAVSLLLLTCPTRAKAQSGRASVNGWVAFEGVAYVDAQPQATVELRMPAPDSSVAYRTRTDEHGFFHFTNIGLGDFVLRITAPHFKEYDAGVYIGSDFIGNWAVKLKVA
ncbi:MAG: carboxypeptidase-like regulatory domain-containing protein, partial [Gemmatimonadota bacterium]